MNFAVNKLSFPLVAHTAYSNARFDSYALLKTGQGAGQLDISCCKLQPYVRALFVVVDALGPCSTCQIGKRFCCTAFLRVSTV
jgi:hypothetical protein